jgi:hypothetical protein
MSPEEEQRQYTAAGIVDQYVTDGFVKSLRQGEFNHFDIIEMFGDTPPAWRAVWEAEISSDFMKSIDHSFTRRAGYARGMVEEFLVIHHLERNTIRARGAEMSQRLLARRDNAQTFGLVRTQALTYLIGVAGVRSLAMIEGWVAEQLDLIEVLRHLSSNVPAKMISKAVTYGIDRSLLTDLRYEL